jgi:hypothetical protein
MVGTTKTMVKIGRRRNANCPNDLPIVSDHGVCHFYHGRNSLAGQALI